MIILKTLYLILNIHGLTNVPFGGCNFIASLFRVVHERCFWLPSQFATVIKIRSSDQEATDSLSVMWIKWIDPYIFYLTGTL